MPALRVATANLLHGVTLTSGRVDLEAHARVLAGLDADVIGLQEVDRLLPRSDSADQVAALADLLGVDGVFAPALSGDPDRSWTTIDGDDPGGPAYGVGLLSRHGLGDVRRTALPGGGPGERAGGGRAGAGAPRSRPPSPGWDREPRVALSATVTVSSAALRVTTTHLSYLPWRGVVQLRHALRAAAGAGPGVLCGDLNLPTWVVRSLARPWRHAGGEPTYPSWRPRAQPDQVVVDPVTAVTGVEVVAGPGDHHVLVATVTLG